MVAALMGTALACGPGESLEDPIGGKSPASEPDDVGDGKFDDIDEAGDESGGRPDGKAGMDTGAGESTGGEPPEDDSAGFVVRPDAGDVSLLALGEYCTGAHECESRECFFAVPQAVIGFCSECTFDTQCSDEDGVGTCSFAEQPYAECTDGSAGNLCQAESSCQPGLLCAGFAGVDFCSECSSDADCDAGDTFCTPTLDVGLACLPEGAVAVGQPCFDDHAAACATGHCTQAQYAGSPSGFFVCGECSADADCGATEACFPATVDSGLQGSFCG